jgi:hypothetical protein
MTPWGGHGYLDLVLDAAILTRDLFIGAAVGVGRFVYTSSVFPLVEWFKDRWNGSRIEPVLASASIIHFSMKHLGSLQWCLAVVSCSGVLD